MSCLLRPLCIMFVVDHIMYQIIKCHELCIIYNISCKFTMYHVNHACITCHNKSCIPCWLMFIIGFICLRLFFGIYVHVLWVLDLIRRETLVLITLYINTLTWLLINFYYSHYQVRQDCQLRLKIKSSTLKNFHSL